ncbi:VanZ family protein [Gammaproteobacteria bacterium]|nr:VanZ family protein [Gammaproteobacteria bacterium]
MQASNSMQALRLIWLWTAIGVAMLVVVAFVSLMPAPGVGVNDKVSHLLTYCLLAGWFGLLARNQAILVWTIVALIGYGMIIELLQGQTGYRFAEWSDVFANSIGCLLGATLYFSPLRRLLRSVDAILASRLRR